MRAALSFRIRRHRFVLIAASIVATALLLSFALPPRISVRAAQAPAARPAPYPVMAAARVIATGSILTAADLKPRLVQARPAAGTITQAADAAGRIAAHAIAPGDILNETDLRDAGGFGIAARVPAGKRAFSIRVTEDDIVGGFLQSGDHVDLFATIPGSAFPRADALNQPDRSQAVLLLQNVAVLAVGENTAARGSIQAGARTVSLSLVPPDLARLALAMRFGKVSLAIRRPGDDGVVQTADAKLEDLVRLPVPPRRPAAAKAAAPASRIPLLLGTRTILAGDPR